MAKRKPKALLLYGRVEKQGRKLVCTHAGVSGDLPEMALVDILQPVFEKMVEQGNIIPNWQEVNHED